MRELWPRPAIWGPDEGRAWGLLDLSKGGGLGSCA